MAGLKCDDKLLCTTEGICAATLSDSRAGVAFLFAPKQPLMSPRFIWDKKKKGIFFSSSATFSEALQPNQSVHAERPAVFLKLQN